MNHEHSFGIIPLKNDGSQWHVFIVRHTKGHWGFPKGHPEAGEKPRVAAERELREETGLVIVRTLSDTPISEHYHFRSERGLVNKEVTYFVAEVTGEPRLQQAEVTDGMWVLLSQAKDHLTFPEAHAVCDAVLALLPKPGR